MWDKPKSLSKFTIRMGVIGGGGTTQGRTYAETVLCLCTDVLDP